MPTPKLCAHCHTSFRPKRRDAKYCSPRCRHDAYRQRQDSPRGLTLYRDPWIEEVEPEEVEEIQTPQDSEHVSAYEFFRREEEENRKRELKRFTSPPSPTEPEDLYDSHGVNPQRYPKHYYTYFGKLTPAGWRGIDPMDREALLRKSIDLFSDYEWLEEDIYLNGTRIDIYEGIKQEMFGQPKPAPVVEEYDPFADFSRKERKAAEKYLNQMTCTIWRLQDWQQETEQGVHISSIEDLLEELRDYLDSKSHRHLPEDFPMGDWLEEVQERLEKYLERLIDEEIEQVIIEFPEWWEDSICEVEGVVMDFEID